MKARIKMKNETVKLLFAVALGSFLVSGCQTGSGGHAPAAAGVADKTAVSDAPPAPKVEVSGRPPGGTSVWVPGYWRHSEKLWIWVPGSWQIPPRPGAAWRAGHWDQDPTKGSWVWTPGHWD
jgi:hypothetical protein